MRTILFMAFLLVGTNSFAETCKKADLKDCAKVLKAKEGADDFVATYDRICSENKGFRCLKRTVRGDLKEEMTFMKEEFPKAHLFPTKDGGEDKVFVLEKK